MAGSHRMAGQNLRSVLSALLCLVLVATVVGIVATQVNWHHNSKTVAPTVRVSTSVLPSSSIPTVVPTPIITQVPHIVVPPANSAPSSPTLVYIVQPGDNLTVIAEGFMMHGYEKLYLQNQKLIGSNPNLIRPGQHLVIVPGSKTQKVVTP